MLEVLHDHLRREPFVPVRIALTSGQALDVYSPYMVAHAENYLFYAHPRSDRFAHLRLNQLASLEVLDAGAA